MNSAFLLISVTAAALSVTNGQWGWAVFNVGLMIFWVLEIIREMR